MSSPPAAPITEPEVPPARSHPRPLGWRAWLVDTDPSGPSSVHLLHAALALVSLGAWLSLWSEVLLLLGWKGLTPVQMTLLQARGSNIHLSWFDFPSHLFFSDSDASIVGGCVVGVALSLLALLGVWPRVMFALNGLLYLGYCVAAETFLGFQWDNLLVESCFIAALLPRDRVARAAHWMGRALLFKVFFQSGVAKWGSPTGDWFDGSAMAHYYETAPLPTALAWYAHHLPDGWHRLESWWTLLFELVFAWGVFLGRIPRMAALAAFTVFFVVDFATANYGFFVPLTAVWCLLLLPGSTTQAVVGRLRSVLRRAPLKAVAPSRRRSVARLGLAGIWTATSLYMASVPLLGINVDHHRWRSVRKWRFANAYHLFSSITTRRHEAEFQTSTDGETWTAHAMVYKAGPVDRAPPFVAPHQPRVDFRLWFFGLSWQRSTPPYVANLLRRMCWDPDVVQPLFSTPLPSDTKYVRIAYWDHAFAPPGSSDWWTRSPVDFSRTISCDQLGW
ncbi:MAG: hypothetical protein CL927_18180 [Deltaproteobacteria bacterium]|nr:hypothetical protein [Deltaproteobacteria bacterium]